MATERRFMLIGQGARKDKDQTISGEWDFSSPLTLNDDVNLNFGTDADYDMDFNSSSGDLIIDRNGTGGGLRVSESAAVKLWVDHDNNRIDIRDGYEVYIRDSDDSDWIELLHNGTYGLAQMDAGATFPASFSGEHVASSLADDDTVTFGVVRNLDEGILFVVTSGSYFDCAIVGHNGTSCQLLAGNSTYVSVGTAATNPDVDGDINIWKPTTTTISIKNRRGASRAISVFQLGL